MELNNSYGKLFDNDINVFCEKTNIQLPKDYIK